MSEKSPIKELPEYKFAASADMTEQSIRDVSEFLAGYDIEFPAEDQEKSAERIREINGLIENQLLWLETTLGLSAKARTPLIEKIKFYKPEAWQKLDVPSQNTSRSEGFHTTPIRKIMVLEHADKRRTLLNLNHEIVHALSRLTLHIRKKGDKRHVAQGRMLGYDSLVSGSLRTLNEVVTETINLETIDFYKHQADGKDYSGGREPAYALGVIFLDMALESIARSSNKTHEEVRGDLYRGYFEGDPSALRIFDKTFGRGALKILSSLTIDQKGFDTLVETAKIFKVDAEGFKSRVSRYQSGQTVRLYSGIDIRLVEYSSL